MKQKKSNNRFSSEMLEIMNGLHKAGCVDKVTMREFDQLCFKNIKSCEAKEIKKIREKV
jgi:putative transcriptional regulator